MRDYSCIRLISKGNDLKGTYRYVVVEEKEDPEDEAERECNANPMAIELPELDKPAAPISRLKGTTDGQRERIAPIEQSPVGTACRGHQRDRHTIVGEETASVAVEECRIRHPAECKSEPEHDQGKDDGRKDAGGGSLGG